MTTPTPARRMRSFPAIGFALALGFLPAAAADPADNPIFSPEVLCDHGINPDPLEECRGVGGGVCEGPVWEAVCEERDIDPCPEFSVECLVALIPRYEF